MNRKIVVNPLPKIFDYVQEDTRPFPPFTFYSCGTLKQLEDGAQENRVDACKLPLGKTRQVMDFGTLDDLCGEE